jgi:hypothetical protein
MGYKSKFVFGNIKNLYILHNQNGLFHQNITL